MGSYLTRLPNARLINVITASPARRPALPQLGWPGERATGWGYFFNSPAVFKNSPPALVAALSLPVLSL